MSSDSRNNEKGGLYPFLGDLSVTLSCENRNQGEFTVTGTLEHADEDKLLVTVDTPDHLRDVYVAECGCWDEELTICDRSWRRLGSCVAITVNKTPVYSAPL